jgi:hypothetical protein
MISESLEHRVMSDDKRKDLCNLLSYAEELLRISERVVADLSRDALRVFHEYPIARLDPSWTVKQGLTFLGP